MKNAAGRKIVADLWKLPVFGTELLLSQGSSTHNHSFLNGDVAEKTIHDNLVEALRQHWESHQLPIASMVEATAWCSTSSLQTRYPSQLTHSVSALMFASPFKDPFDALAGDYCVHVVRHF